MSDVSVPYMEGCAHLYQCLNPLCQHVFACQHHLSIHFYHQDNVFCNSPKWFLTNVEVALPSYLLYPERCHGCHQILRTSLGTSDMESESDDIGKGGPPHVVHVDNTN
jgi:hypothetical protein